MVQKMQEVLAWAGRQAHCDQSLQPKTPRRALDGMRRYRRFAFGHATAAAQPTTAVADVPTPATHHMQY